MPFFGSMEKKKESMKVLSSHDLKQDKLQL